MRRLVSVLAVLILFAVPLASNSTAEAAPSRTPKIGSLSALFGTTAGGTTVTINGSNFRDATAVLFGGTRGTNFQLLSSSQIRVTTPARGVGIADVQVVSSAGTSATSQSAKFAFHTTAPAGSTVKVTKTYSGVSICQTGTTCGAMIALTTTGFGDRTSVFCHVTKSDIGAYGDFWIHKLSATATSSNVSFSGSYLEVTCDGVVSK